MPGPAVAVQGKLAPLVPSGTLDRVLGPGGLRVMAPSRGLEGEVLEARPLVALRPLQRQGSAKSRAFVDCMAETLRAPAG